MIDRYDEQQTFVKMIDHRCQKGEMCYVRTTMGLQRNRRSQNDLIVWMNYWIIYYRYYC